MNITWGSDTEINMAIKTTTECNGACNDCSVMAWMKADPGWHASLKDIDRFLWYSQRSGYTYNIVNLTGGEPLLWKNLIEGTRMLRKSGLIKEFCLYTNALALQPGNMGVLDQIIEDLDYVRISRYRGNEANIEFALGWGYPEGKIRISDAIRRPVPPVNPVANSLPADCHCRGFALDHSQVFVCAPAPTIIYARGISFDDFPDISSPLGMNFLEQLSTVDIFNQELCRYCVGNQKVSDVVDKTDCIVKKE